MSNAMSNAVNAPIAVALFSVFVLLTGCANVAPYEREHLADPIVDINDRESAAYEEHMHRALSQGLIGPPRGGGGCGCEQ